MLVLERKEAFVSTLGCSKAPGMAEADDPHPSIDRSPFAGRPARAQRIVRTCSPDGPLTRSRPHRTAKPDVRGL